MKFKYISIKSTKVSYISQLQTLTNNYSAEATEVETTKSNLQDGAQLLFSALTEYMRHFFFYRAVQGNFKISTLTYEKFSFPPFQDGLRIRSQKKIS